MQGDPDQAGFVQVIQGRTSDPQRARELMNEGPDDWSSFRPDMLGSLSVGHDEGDYTVVLYFTSEEEAREGERKEPPAELKAQMDEWDKLEVRRARLPRPQAALALLAPLNRTRIVRMDYVRYPRSHRELG